MEKRVAVVTGGTSGIGLQAALQLSSSGYQAYVFARHPAEITGLHFVACDVAVQEDVESAVGKVMKAEGQIDLLINNAGFGISGAIEFTETANAKRLIETNLFGMDNMVKAVLPVMRKQNHGRIINVGSLAGMLSIPYQTWYSVSKAAVCAYTQGLINEVRQFGISACCIMPGDTRTGFTAVREKCIAGDQVYNGCITRSVRKMELDEQNGMPAETAGKYIAYIAEKKKVKPYYAIGFTNKVFAILARFLPCRMVSFILGILYSGK